MNNGAVNVLVFVWTYVFPFLELIRLRVELLGHMVVMKEIKLKESLIRSPAEIKWK